MGSRVSEYDLSSCTSTPVHNGAFVNLTNCNLSCPVGKEALSSFPIQLKCDPDTFEYYVEGCYESSSDPVDNLVNVSSAYFNAGAGVVEDAGEVASWTSSVGNLVLSQNK